jgi:hypothetical protein
MTGRAACKNIPFAKPDPLPAREITMRISGREVLTGVALAGLFLMIAIAMAFVARIGFLGVGIIGVLTWFICVRLELEKDAAVGNVMTTGLYAQQMRAREAMTRAEKAADREEQTALLQSVRFFKRLGIGLTVIGLGMFALYQL